MSLYDLIFRKNRVDNNENIENAEVPQIQAVVQDIPYEQQVNQAMRAQVGNAYDNPSLYNRIVNKVKNFNLVDKYDDTTENENFTTTDEEGNPVLNSGLGTAPLKQRGFLSDFKRGANENFNNKFEFDNLGKNKLTNGMPKNFATRLGEAAGSIGRFFNSPYGRGLLTAGIIGATGGNGIQAMAFGSSATRQNQQHLLNDDIYRKALKEYGVDTGNIKGYINKETFDSLANNMYKQNSLAVKQAIAGQTDNTKRANMIMNGLKSGMITPQEAKTLMDSYGITINDLKMSNESELLPFKQYALSTAPQVALGNLGVAQGNLGLAQERYNLDYMKFLKDVEEQNNPKPDKAVLKSLSENEKTIADIDAGLKLIKENPQAYSFFKGKIGSDIANRIDPKGVPTRTQIDNITAVYRKWLTGAQMSDAERKAYERFLPAPTDNARIVEAKLQGMKNSIQRQNDVIKNTYGGYFNVPASTFNVDASALDAELKRRGL